MDAFFASVEQRDRPELRGKPVAVGGASDRGVVAAASYEARRFGVHSAMPSYEARRRCPELIFLRGDMALYARESRRIFEIFREFSPRVEGLSLDEAFLDLSGTQRLLGAARDVGERLRTRVREETQLAVSVGIAPFKMVAKIASASAKPDGLLVVSPEAVRGFLEPLPVRRIWGMGPVTESKLLALGFSHLGDLARSEDGRLHELLGDWGVRIAKLARGEDVRDVEAYRDAVSYSEENTFARDVSDRSLLESAIVTHAESVARRIRRDGLVARTVVLKLKLGRRRAPGPRGYPLLTRRMTLREPTDDGDQIAHNASALLARAALQEPVRLLGVGVTNLGPKGEGQLGLFGQPETEKTRSNLNRALDEIAERFGTGAVVRGSREAALREGLSMQIKRGEHDEADDAGEDDEAHDAGE
jgi:DNA polymerase-4